MASPAPELEQTPAAAGTGTGPGTTPTHTDANHTITPVVRSQRILACVLCQQRKVKCDRKFPCVHCVRAGVDCVPAALLPRQRRRRFPERELLERLRHYETLLRQNNINFRPLHPDFPVSLHVAAAEHASSSNANRRDSDGRDVDSFDDAHSEVSSKDKTIVKSEAKPVYALDQLSTSAFSEYTNC